MKRPKDVSRAFGRYWFLGLRVLLLLLFRLRVFVS